MYHDPVLAREVADRLVTSPGGLYLDCTMGGGGHSRLILESLDATGRLLALDWDEDAHTHQQGVDQVLCQDARVALLRQSFGDLDRLPAPWAEARFHGVLMDLGLSSHQIDTPGRGFSYLQEGPLDMRMDRRKGVGAGELIDQMDEAALGRLLRDQGEVASWRRMAHLLKQARAAGRLDGTAQVRQVVEDAFGTKGSYALLSRVFQALRIAVNGELEALEKGLDEAFRRLLPGGRLAVITYHSLEDRHVKARFRDWCGEGGQAGTRHVPAMRTPRVAHVLERRGVVPTAEEIARNPRSRSARLRVLEREVA